ncbi:MAG: hypothetical protein OXN89_25835 [Bryobacterales bacterium]|nr:hypothetical protein [Bryobacterales bacterium]
MGRDVSAIGAENAQPLNLGIQDGEASAVQRHEAFRIGERVRSGALEGADADFFDQSPAGGHVCGWDVRDLDRAGGQGVPLCGPVGP